MNVAFYLIAGVMIAAALALLLLPLVRVGRRSGRPRSVFALALLIALMLPAGAAGIYLLVGTPAALQGVPRQAEAPASIAQALDELRQHLAAQPGDSEGWTLLGRTLEAMGQSATARDAYAGALKADPRNVVAMVGWAQADAASRADHRLEGRARQLLDQALAVDPANQRALWLTGIAQYQAGEYRQAVASWQRLQPMLPADSTVAQAVAQQIGVAQARAQDQQPTAPSGAAAATPALTVQVSLAPALRGELRQGDVLFVYARAPTGAAMPLAVARLDPQALPLSVTLTDAMAMMPGHGLSSQPRVQVGARISHSGQPIAQPGDLEGDAGIVDTATRTPIEVHIARRH